MRALHLETTKVSLLSHSQCKAPTTVRALKQSTSHTPVRTHTLTWKFEKAIPCTNTLTVACFCTSVHTTCADVARGDRFCAASPAQNRPSSSQSHTTSKSWKIPSKVSTTRRRGHLSNQYYLKLAQQGSLQVPGGPVDLPSCESLPNLCSDNSERDRGGDVHGLHDKHVHEHTVGPFRDHLGGHLIGG